MAGQGPWRGAEGGEVTGVRAGRQNDMDGMSTGGKRVVEQPEGYQSFMLGTGGRDRRGGWEVGKWGREGRWEGGRGGRRRGGLKGGKGGRRGVKGETDDRWGAEGQERKSKPWKKASGRLVGSHTIEMRNTRPRKSILKQAMHASQGICKHQHGDTTEQR